MDLGLNVALHNNSNGICNAAAALGQFAGGEVLTRTWVAPGVPPSNCCSAALPADSPMFECNEFETPVVKDAKAIDGCLATLRLQQIQLQQR